MSHRFEKAPEIEYRRRSWLSRMLHRPLFVVALVAAVAVVTVLGLRLKRTGPRPSLPRAGAAGPANQSLTTTP